MAISFLNLHLSDKDSRPQHPPTMTLASIVLAFASLALCCSIETTSAASACSQAEYDKLLTIMSEIVANDSCLSDVLNNTDCPSNQCLVILEKWTPDVPSCIIDGKNAKANFQQMLSNCKSSTSTSTSPSTAKSAANSPSFTFSASVALSSATAAVVAVMV